MPRDTVFKQAAAQQAAVEAAAQQAAAQAPATPIVIPANIGGETGFDGVAYANAYPDVFAACGYDEAALWMHYLTFGQAEGRTFFAK